MRPRTDFTDIPPPLARQRRVWRGLVTFQLLVAAVIIAALVVIAVTGVTGSLFGQRGV